MSNVPSRCSRRGSLGRYCHLKVGDEDAADRGGLYLPASIDIFEDEALNAAIYRLRVLVQLGFREFGTFAFDIHRARARIPALASRPLPPAHRESDLTVFFNHFDTPPVARFLFHVIELARVEAQTLRRYPGARKYQVALAPHRDAPIDFLRPVIDRVCAADATVYDTAEAVIECYDMLYVDAEEAGRGVFAGQMEWAQREARLEDWERELDEAEAQVAAMEVAELAGGDEVKVGEGRATAIPVMWGRTWCDRGTICSVGWTRSAPPCGIDSARRRSMRAVSCTTSGTTWNDATERAGADCSKSVSTAETPPTAMAAGVSCNPFVPTRGRCGDVSSRYVRPAISVCAR